MASDLSSHLVPCPGCSRHVRAREDACPFCRAALPDEVRSSAPPRRIAARLSRAGLIAAGATAAAIAASGCGDTMATTDYGAPGLPYDDDASTVIADASVVPDDAAEAGDAMHDDVERSEASMPMTDASDTTDASDGGPPLDAGSDAADGD
jgi:hypothetical protein